MPHRRLKRKACVLVLLLLAGGAIVNVAVAWSIAYFINPLNDAWGQPRGSFEQSIDYGTSTWAVWRNRRAGSLWVLSNPRYDTSFDRPDKGPSPATLLPRWAATELTPTGPVSSQDPNADRVCRTVHATGWPALVTFGLYGGARADHVLHASALPSATSQMTKGGFAVPRALLLRPIWSGLAINTIFYAAILALLFYGPGKVWRFVRVKRGRCPACGYIIAPGTCAPGGGGGLCSECGATLPKRLVRPRSA
jgi:hypothetical protein